MIETIKNQTEKARAEKYNDYPEKFSRELQKQSQLWEEKENQSTRREDI